MRSPTKMAFFYTEDGEPLQELPPVEVPGLGTDLHTGSAIQCDPDVILYRGRTFVRGGRSEYYETQPYEVKEQ